MVPTMSRDDAAFLDIAQRRNRYVQLCGRASEMHRAGNAAEYERLMSEARGILDSIYHPN